MRWLMFSVLALCILAAASEAPALLGVDLGATHIRVAYFDGDQSILIAPLQGSTQYRAYMADTLENEGVRIQNYGKWYIRVADGHLVPAPLEVHDSVAAAHMFTRALFDVKDLALRETGKRLRIGAVSYPDHFNTTSKNSLLSAMESVDPMLYDAYRFRPSYFGAAFTWPQDHCSKEYASLGLQSWEVDEPDYALLVDTSFERIRITLAELYRDVAMLAEEAIIQGGAEELQSTVKNYAGPHLHALQAVILRGDSNVSTSHQVRGILQRMVPELEGKVKECKRGCEFVNALGAACVARQLTLYPDFMDDGDPGYTGMGPHGHDELRWGWGKWDTGRPYENEVLEGPDTVGEFVDDPFRLDNEAQPEDVGTIAPSNCQVITDNEDDFEVHCAYKGTYNDAWISTVHSNFTSADGSCTLSDTASAACNLAIGYKVHPDCKCGCDGVDTTLLSSGCAGWDGTLDGSKPNYPPRDDAPGPFE